MQVQAKAANLTEQQIRDIAEWVGGRKLGLGQSAEAKDMPNSCRASPPMKDSSNRPSWNGCDPDNNGALVWKSDISRGEIAFGGATDGTQAYFSFRGCYGISRLGAACGGLAAIQLSDGVEKWFTPISPQESMSVHSGLIAAVTAIPGVVFTAGLDGMLRAFSAFNGRSLWEYDTTREVKTVNGVTVRGGSIGSAGATVAGGMVYVPSGYTGFQRGHPGNLLLAFGAPER